MTQAATAPAGVGSLGFRKGADATTVLTAYVLLLWFVPSAMVVPALGSAGSPASLLGVACAFWWAWSHIQRTRSTGVGLQPVRMAMLVWMLIMLVVYAHAMPHPDAERRSQRRGQRGAQAGGGGRCPAPRQ